MIVPEAAARAPQRTGLRLLGHGDPRDGPGAAWLRGSFLSTLVYLVLLGFEIALAEQMRLADEKQET